MKQIGRACKQLFIWMLALGLTVGSVCSNLGPANFVHAQDEEWYWRSVGGRGSIHDGGNSFSSAFAIAEDGTPYVVFREANEEGNVYVVKKYDGNSWVYVGGDDSSHSNGVFFRGDLTSPVMLMDGDGKPLLAYVNSSKKQLYVLKLRDNQWELLHEEDKGLPRSTGMKLAVDSNGTLYAVYTEAIFNINYKRIGERVKVSSFSNGKWEDVGGEVYSVEEGNSISSHFSLALSDDDIPYVSYKIADGDLKEHVSVKRLAQSGDWEDVGGQDASGAVIESFALKVHGETPYIAFRENTEGLISVKVLNSDNQWVHMGGVQHVNDQWAGNWAFNLDHEGTPYAVYTERFNDYNLIVQKWDGGAWQDVGNIGAITAGRPQSVQDIQIDGNGYTHILSRDQASDVIKLELFKYAPAQAYTVTYQAGEFGLFDEASEVIAEGQFPVAVPEPVAEPGYGFIGWSGSDAPDTLLTSEQVGEKPVTGDIAYTALFRRQVTGLAVSAEALSGSEPYWKTRITVNSPVEPGHRLVYRNFPLDGLQIPVEGETLTDYRELPADGIVYGTNNDYIAVAQVDANDVLFRFGYVRAATVELMPEAPVLEPAVMGDGQVSLAWQPVAGATGYKIYRVDRFASGDVSGWTQLDEMEGTQTSYTVTGLANGTDYYFVVSAVCPGGESGYSNEVAASPGALPGAPDNIGTAPGNGYIRVSFDAPADDGGRSIKRYEVLDSSDGIVASGLESPITVRGLDKDVQYRFRVRAVTALGSGPLSAESDFVSPDASDVSGVAGYFSDMDKPDTGREAMGYASEWLGKGTLDRNDNAIVVEDISITGETEALLFEGTVRAKAFFTKINRTGYREWLAGLYTTGKNRYDGPGSFREMPGAEQAEPYYFMNAEINLQDVAALEGGSLVAGGAMGIKKYEGTSIVVNQRNVYWALAPDAPVYTSFPIKELKRSPGEATREWSVPYYMTGKDPAIEGFSLFGSTYDAIFVRTGEDGRVERIDSLGGYGDESVIAVEATSDGGFVAIGTTTSTDGDFAGLPDWPGLSSFIVKYDREGNRQWLRKLGGESIHWLASIHEVPGGGYVLAGSVQQGTLGTDEDRSFPVQFSVPPKPATSYAGLVLKLDEEGHLNWVQSYYDGAMSNYLDAVASSDGSEIAAAGEISWNASEGAGYGGGTMLVHITGAFAHTYRASDGEPLAAKSYSRPQDKLFSSTAESRPNRLVYAAPVPEGGYLLAGQAAALSAQYDVDLMAPNGDVKGLADIVVLKTNAELEVEWFSFVGTSVEDFYQNQVYAFAANKWGLFASTQDGFTVGYNRLIMTSSNNTRLGGYVARYSYDWDEDGIVNSRDFYPEDPERSIPGGEYAGWIDLDREPAVTAATYLSWQDIVHYPPSGSVYGDVYGNPAYNIPNVAIRAGEAMVTVPVPALDRIFRGADRYNTLSFAGADSAPAVTGEVGALLAGEGYRLIRSFDLTAEIGGRPVVQMDTQVKITQTVTGITYGDLVQLFAYNGAALEPVDSAAFGEETLVFTASGLGTYIVAETDDPDVLAARAVRLRIAELPDLEQLTLEHKEQVLAIRLEYDALRRQELVTNLPRLQAAEARLISLQAMSEAEAALPVAELLENLPAASLVKLADEEQIMLARTSYELLTEGQRTFIPSSLLNRLIAAEQELEGLKAAVAADAAAAAAVAEQIASLPAEPALAHKSLVEAARTAYSSLTQAQKALIAAEQLNKLEAAEAKIKELEASSGNPGGGSPGGGAPGGSVPSEEPVEEDDDTPDSLDNDPDMDISAFGQATATEQGSRKITTFVVDSAQLLESLKEREASAVRRLILSIPVLDPQAEAVIAEFDEQFANAFGGEEAVLEIRTENVRYSLPLNELAVWLESGLAGEGFTSKASIRVEIARAAPETAEALLKAAADEGYEVLVEPLSFSIKAESGGSVLEWNRFAGYVERRFVLPQAGRGQRVTGVAVEADGGLRHVPTRVEQEDGASLAVISSMTNSVYAVIQHSVSFLDVDGHWSEDAVHDMGSRMIVGGTGGGMFEPDQAVTRAEFAAMLVRSLGLGQEAVLAPFSDVPALSWYSNPVNTAYAYQLINGFEDGTFRPAGRITREEAMSMIAKAMELTGLSGELPSGSVLTMLEQFADAAEVADWAQAAVADCLAAEIVGGRSGQQLAPKAEISRAEAAVMLQRLLKKANLIG